MISRGDSKHAIYLFVVCLSILIFLPCLYKELLGADSYLPRIVSSVIYGLPVVFLLSLVRNRWLFAVISGVVMAVSFAETMMVVLYDNYLIAGNILAVFSTNAEEGRAFLCSSVAAIGWSLPVVVAWLAAVYIRTSAVFGGAKSLILFGLSLLLMIGMLTYQLQFNWGGNITTRFYVEQNVLGRPPYNFWFQLKSIYDQSKLRDYIADSENMSFGATRPEVPDKEIYVLAIGESLRYDNLSLAGYGRSTTPHLDSLSNVTLYSDYYSTANLTMYSVPQIITRATPDSYVLSYKEKSLFKPFQECGFKTFVISPDNLLAESHTSYLSNGCDGMLALPALSDELIAHKIDSLASLYDKTFFIVQFFGNHGPYRNFREAQNVYHPNPVSDNASWSDYDAMVNAYDNTVLFTDYNIYSIIKTINRENTQSAFMMVSDHGADYDLGFGISDHGGNCSPRKAEYHVPLIFWHSNLWGENHSRKLVDFVSHKDLPVNADNIFYSVCDMADIVLGEPYSVPEWSLFSHDLQLHDRYILVPDGKNRLRVEN